MNAPKIDGSSRRNVWLCCRQCYENSRMIAVRSVHQKHILIACGELLIMMKVAMAELVLILITHEIGVRMQKQITKMIIELPVTLKCSPLSPQGCNPPLSSSPSSSNKLAGTSHGVSSSERTHSVQNLITSAGPC
jgi:hypothetical protein